MFTLIMNVGNVIKHENNEQNLNLHIIVQDENRTIILELIILIDVFTNEIFKDIIQTLPYRSEINAIKIELLDSEFKIISVTNVKVNL